MKLLSIFRENKVRLSITFVLILIEAGLALLFPLFIGYAIDDAISGQQAGLVQLGLLSLAALLIGLGRRVIDTRFYAKIYQTVGGRIIGRMEGYDCSTKAARLGMVRELIEFFENSLPELINNIIGLIGVVIIIATLNLNIFYLSLGITFLIFLIYWMTSPKTIRLNQSANDVLEQEVKVLSQNNEASLDRHLQEVMKWNIKLSDLEAGNFSLSWLTLTSFLILALVIAVGDGILMYGALFALIMYVFQYMESVINLPLFYQNWLRLYEIKKRLERS